jgi:hypothetical protein
MERGVEDLRTYAESNINAALPHMPKVESAWVGGIGAWLKPLRMFLSCKLLSIKAQTHALVTRLCAVRH